MKTMFVITLSLMFSGAAFAAEKIDWKPCKKELEEFCTTAGNDTEKHECLEELPKGKGSKACVDFNHKVESKLGHKHGNDGHKH